MKLIFLLVVLLEAVLTRRSEYGTSLPQEEPSFQVHLGKVVMW